MKSAGGDMAAIQTSETIRRLRNEWLKAIGGCVAILAAIHILPKSANGAIFRLILTIAYFGAALELLYCLTTRCQQYLKQWYKWRFEDCGPALEQTWKLYLSSLSRLINIAVYLLMAFIGSAALSVFAEWVTPLAAFSFFYNAVWILSFAGLVLFPLVGANFISETYQRYILLRESVETSGFTPRSAKELSEPAC